MHYNFINLAFFIGLLGGGIPWAIIFRSKWVLLFQALCLSVGAANLIYGLHVTAL